MTTLDISPEAQRVIARVDTFLDGIAPDRQDLALLGLECMAFAGTDRPLPEHLKSAQLGAAYEHARQRSIAEAAKQDTPSTSLDDDPVCTVIDSGERSGVRLERYDRPSRESGWLDFRVGYSLDDEECARVLVSTHLYGSTQQGVDLIIAGVSINDRLDDVWTLADLRQLRDDLDRLLRDPRLIGALAEQAV